MTVQTLSSDIEKQELTAGEIRSCVSIADAKRIWQRLAALQIRRSETEDRLLSLIQLLEEQQDLPRFFEDRYTRYLSWASAMKQRLLHKQRALLDDVLQRLSGPLRDELAAKESERAWLVQQGRELSKTCGSQELTNQIANQVVDVEKVWSNLMETWTEEYQRLEKLPADLEGLNSNLAGLTVWLGQVEATVHAPLIVSACNAEAVEASSIQHAQLENSIEQKTPVVSSVLSLGESFTTNYNLLHGWLGTDLDAVQCAMQALQRRWKNINNAAAERSALLKTLWPDWSAVLNLQDQLDQILTDIERAMPTGDDVSSSQDGQLDCDLESLIQKLHAPATRQMLDQLNDRYCHLARDGRLDAAGELQQRVAHVNTRWRTLSEHLSSHLQNSRDASSSLQHWKVRGISSLASECINEFSLFFCC